MHFRFLTLAQQEVDEAYLSLEERYTGAGVDFLADLDRAVRLIEAHPLAHPEIAPGIRRRLFARFSYALLYAIDNQTIVVIAVAHTRRRPNYWLERV